MSGSVYSGYDNLQSAVESATMFEHTQSANKLDYIITMRTCLNMT